MGPELEVIKTFVEAKPRREPLIVSKYIPYWLCGLVNLTFRRPILAKYRLKDFTIERQVGVKCIHGIDVEKEIIESLSQQENRNE